MAKTLGVSAMTVNKDVQNRTTRNKKPNEINGLTIEDVQNRTTDDLRDQITAIYEELNASQKAIVGARMVTSKQGRPSSEEKQQNFVDYADATRNRTSPS